MKQIILDTNFLVYCAKEKIDYAEELRMLVTGKYELATPDMVIKELEKIKEKAKKYTDKQSANLALQLLKVNNVKIFKGDGEYADKAIINASEGNIVATLDLGLTDYLERAIIIRGKRKLTFR